MKGMPEIHLQLLSTTELLQLHGKILSELKARGAVRSTNNPLGDYTEWLVSNRLGLKLLGNSNSGHDAVCENGIRYQIKGRRITVENPSTQLSTIRNLLEKDFDFLVALVFNENFQLLYAVKVPHEAVVEHARWYGHVKGHNLHVRDVLSDNRVIHLLEHFKENPPTVNRQDVS